MQTVWYMLLNFSDENSDYMTQEFILEKIILGSWSTYRLSTFFRLSEFYIVLEAAVGNIWPDKWTETVFD